MPGLADRCGICALEYRFSLQRCAVCRRPVCGDCIIRMSRGVFCTRVCAHAFFYGAEEDVEEQDSRVEEYDEEE